MRAPGHQIGVVRRARLRPGGVDFRDRAAQHDARVEADRTRPERRNARRVDLERTGRRDFAKPTYRETQPFIAAARGGPRIADARRPDHSEKRIVCFTTGANGRPLLRSSLIALNRPGDHRSAIRAIANLRSGGVVPLEWRVACGRYIGPRWHDIIGRSCPVAAAGHLRAQGGGSAESRLSSERTFRFCVIDRCG